MNEAKFIMMVGLSGSGKSYKAKELSKEYDAEIFSSDELRIEMFGDVNHQEDNGKLFVELHKRIKDCLKSGKSAIMDATNISYKKRMAFLAELANIPCEKICVLMATPYEECVKRNAMRERNVPEHAIERMYLNFQCPHYFEGWDDIQIIYNNSRFKPSFNKGSFESMARSFMRGFNQNNPHHIYDVYDHSKALMFQYERGDIRRLAAMLHDCMKKRVQQTDDDGVSHYYNHANVSAYYVLTHPKIVDCQTYDEMLDVLFYITYHMIAHDIQTAKSIKKYQNIFGEQLCNKLLDFACKDKLASNSVIFNMSKQNIYIIQDDYAIGFTRLGDQFLIDVEDIDKVSQYTWCIKQKDKNDFRLVSMTDGAMKFLHRVIMNIDDKDVVVDHINHKQFDNRKSELRLCRVAENCYNTSLSKNNTSGINGVSQRKNGKYRAYINDHYKQINLGEFDTLEDAAKARRSASIQYYGEFANINI